MVEPSAKGEIVRYQNTVTVVDPGPPSGPLMSRGTRPWTLLDLIALVGSIALAAAGHETGLVILYFWFRERKKTGWQ